MRHRVIALLMGLCALGMTSCATNPATGQRQLSLVSEQQEVAMGKEGDTQVKQEYGVYQDAALQAYVSEVGQRMAKLSHRTNLPWTFTVVDSPEINAFALPGGWIYITRGLMAYLDSEAELAGVLGHEIGHVTARHGAQQQTQSTIGQVLSVGAEILGQVLGGVQGAGQIVGGIAGSMIQQHGHDHELEADKLGAEYISRVGFDARQMIKVIGVLKAQEVYAEDRARAQGRPPQRMPEYGSTHPSNEQRLQEINAIASRYPPAAGDTGRERYLARINNLTFGDSREQGVIRGNNFYHEPLAITLNAPAGWRFQNTPDKLVAMNANQTAAVAMLPAGTGGTHEEIIRKAFNPARGQVDRININGDPATYFIGVAVNEQRQQVPIEAVVLTHANTNYLFQIVAKEAPPQGTGRAEARELIRSFHTMTPQERAAAQPQRLRTYVVRSGETYASLARGAGDPQSLESRLRLLNGQYPAGELSAGRSIKVLAQ